MIFIIRHGETDLNRAQVLQGRSDCPLNERGILQAREAARFLRERGVVFSRVFSSPLVRAVQTARIIAPELGPEIEPRLIEMDYGPYEGMELKRPAPEVLAFFRDFAGHPAPEGMEQLSEVVDRVGGFLETVRVLPGNILLSTHAIAMKGALEYLTPGSHGSFWSRFLGNCAVYAVPHSEDGFGVPEAWRE